MIDMTLEERIKQEKLQKENYGRKILYKNW